MDKKIKVKGKARCLYADDETWEKIIVESQKDRRSASNFLIHNAFENVKKNE